MTSKVRPKFIETETEIKQSAATINKDLVLNKSLKLTNNGIFRYNNGFIEFSFNAGTSWYQLGDKLKEWVSEKAYAINDTVIYLDKIYRCDVANSDVVFVDDNWTAIGGGAGGGGSAQTGLLTGGSLSINANNTSVDVSAIVARVVDDYTDPTNPVTYDLNIDATNVPITNVATAGLTYLYIDKTGAFVQSLTQLNNSQMRDHILLGAIIHTVGGVINAVNNVTEGVVNGLGLAFLDLQRQQGVRNYEGNIFTPAAGNPLGFDKTEGKILFFGGNYKIDPKSPNTPSSAALTNPQFFTTWRNGSGGWNNLVTQSIAPNLYDNGTGTLATVANNKWTAKRLYLVQSGIVVQHAQGQFASRIEALTDAQYGSFDLNPDLRENALFVGWILTSGADTGWVSSNLVLSSTGSAGASAAVTLNSWGVENITSAQSPYTVTSTRKFILVDASGGPVTVRLQDVSSGTADWETRIYMVDNTNPVTVTTVGGSQLIGDSTTQKIFQDNEGFSVVADFANLKYVITQDNRKDTTFKTPQHTWALFKNYPAVDLTNSNLVGGSSVAGDNHYVTMTTGTTSGAYFVSIPVSSEEILQVRNFFRFLFTTAITNQFSVGVQGFNGSVWTDLATQELGIGDKSWGLISFDLGSYVSYRIKVIQLGTTAGRTFTLSRGEWTDRFSEIVEVKNDSESYFANNALQATVVTRSVYYSNVQKNTLTDKLISVENSSTNGLIITAKTRCLVDIVCGVYAQYKCLYKNVTANVDPYDTGYNANRVDYVQSSGAAIFDHLSATIELEAGETLVPRYDTFGSGYSERSSVTITATPLSSSKGYVYQADFDRSEFEWPSYDPYALGLFTAYSSAPTGARTSVRPYKTSEGKVFMDFAFDIDVASASRSTWSCTIGSISPVRIGTCAVSNSSTTVDCLGNISFSGAFLNSHGVATTNRYYYEGTIELSSWPTWATKSVKPFPMNIVGPVAVKDQTVWLKDVKPSGTAGGASVVGWQTRVLNTVQGASDIVSLSSNQFTLGDGEYELYFSTPGYATNRNKAAIYNVTDAKYELLGNTGYAPTADGWSLSEGLGTLLVSGSKTFELRNYVFASRINGLGLPASSGQDEVYGQVQITKIGETGLIASPAKDAHKNATYLSSTETEAGFTDQGQKVYKRSYRFSGLANGAAIDSALKPSIVTPTNGWAYVTSLTAWAKTNFFASASAFQDFRMSEASGLTIGQVGAPNGSLEIEYTKNSENP